MANFNVCFSIHDSGNVNVTVYGTNIDVVSKPAMNTDVFLIQDSTGSTYERTNIQTVRIFETEQKCF